MNERFIEFPVVTVQREGRVLEQSLRQLWHMPTAFSTRRCGAGPKYIIYLDISLRYILIIYQYIYIFYIQYVIIPFGND